MKPFYKDMMYFQECENGAINIVLELSELDIREELGKTVLIYLSSPTTIPSEPTKHTNFHSQAQYDLSVMVISSGLQSKAFVAVDNPAHEAILYKPGWHNFLTVMLQHKLVEK
jgi:hypothetical protein